MILEAVDALTTLLTFEVALLWITLLFGDGSILLHFALRSLEAIGARAFPIDVRCVVTTRSIICAEPTFGFQSIIGGLTYGRRLALTVLSSKETISGGTVASPLAVVFLLGALATIEARSLLIADLILGLTRQTNVLVVFGTVAVPIILTGNEIGIQCLKSTEIGKALLADGPVLARKRTVGLLGLCRHQTEGQRDQHCRRRLE